MKFSLILLFAFLVGCSSSKEKKSSAPENVSNESFKKERPLTKAQIQDFYQGNAKTLSPALQDETLDRLTDEELKELKTEGDPLIEISVACSRRDFTTGFKVASAHLTRYQKVPQYWNLVANCHLNQGSHRKALLFYNKALEVSPNFIPALNNIGVMYSRQGLDQKALVAFERANKQSKFSKTPRYNLAKLYLTYGLSESALPLFQSLLNETPTDVDLLNAVGTAYYMMSDYGRAYSYYQRIPQAQWRRAEIGLNLAMTLKKTNRLKEAVALFDDIEKPSNASLRRYYAAVGTQLGDAE